MVAERTCSGVIVVVAERTASGVIVVVVRELLLEYSL